MDQLENMRLNYQRGTLERESLLDDPFTQAKEWLQIAIDHPEIPEPSAFSLATANEDNQPSIRTLLLKGITEEGFIFYTNYNSLKGRDIEGNNKVAMLLFWQPLERQIRIQGQVHKIDEEQSVKYFQSRPKGSQLGAWASAQSEVVQDRSELDDRLAELTDVYAAQQVLPKPPHWGGYILIPTYFEFWQGRKNRMHDRFRYIKSESNWGIDRLAP